MFSRFSTLRSAAIVAVAGAALFSSEASANPFSLLAPIGQPPMQAAPMPQEPSTTQEDERY